MAKFFVSTDSTCDLFLEERQSLNIGYAPLINTIGDGDDMKLVEDILKNCQNSTKLCIACDITLETEYIKTQTVAAWRKTTLPDLAKRPTIFLLYK